MAERVGVVTLSLQRRHFHVDPKNVTELILLVTYPVSADFRAGVRFQRETINHSQQSQNGDQNESHMKIGDRWYSARITVE